MERFDLDKTQSTVRAFAVTPNDSTDLLAHTRGLYIGGVGTIRVTHVLDTDPTDYPVTAAGYIYPWAVKRVHATGTTATNIIAQI
jgi:hypothetical protein